MKVIFKILFLTLLVGSFMFARNGRNEVTSINKSNLEKVSNHYWAEGNGGDDGDNLDRKRSHKRRRKVRKPIKGLR